MMDSRTLETIYDYKEMLLGLEGSAKPEFVKADQGELIIDNGKMWYATWSEYSIFYPIKLATDLGTDYYLTNALLTVDHQVTVCKIVSCGMTVGRILLHYMVKQ